MVTARAVVHGDRERLLGMEPGDGPTVLQLGGSEPAIMAEAAAVGEAWGHDEININVGCPSDRVQSGRFGACLMAEPVLVADNVRAMRDAGRRAGHGQVPPRHRSRRQLRGARALRAARCRRRLRARRRARPEGLARRAQPEGEPERAAASLRARLPPEGGDAGPARHDQRRHRRLVGGARSPSPRSTGVMLGRHAYYHPAFLARADVEVFADLDGGREPADDVAGARRRRAATTPATPRAGSIAG